MNDNTYSADDYNSARVRGEYANAAIIAQAMGWKKEAARMQKLAGKTGEAVALDRTTGETRPLRNGSVYRIATKRGEILARFCGHYTRTARRAVLYWHRERDKSGGYAAPILNAREKRRFARGTGEIFTCSKAEVCHLYFGHPITGAEGHFTSLEEATEFANRHGLSINP